MIEKNVAQLGQYDLGDLMSRLSVEEVNEEIVCYVNLLVNKKTGEILDLSSKVKWAENAISTPVAIKTTGLFTKEATCHLELASEGDLPAALKLIIKKSLQVFNETLSNKKIEG